MAGVNYKIRGTTWMAMQGKANESLQIPTLGATLHQTQGYRPPMACATGMNERNSLLPSKPACRLFTNQPVAMAAKPDAGPQCNSPQQSRRARSDTDSAVPSTGNQAHLNRHLRYNTSGAPILAGCSEVDERVSQYDLQPKSVLWRPRKCHFSVRAHGLRHPPDTPTQENSHVLEQATSTR